MFVLEFGAHDDLSGWGIKVEVSAGNVGLRVYKTRKAVVVGVAVFTLWVGLDGFYPSLDQLLGRLGLAKAKSNALAGWNPHAEFDQAGALAWMFVVVRGVGSTIVVPPLEEVFYRSFFYRYLVKADFQSVPLGRLIGMPFVVTSAVFGFSHGEWLAGILCGFAYQGLVCRKERLGDAMTAHAITNGLLALWVVGRGAWKFW